MRLWLLFKEAKANESQVGENALLHTTGRYNRNHFLIYHQSQSNE